jgi:aspartate aminotransferase
MLSRKVQSISPSPTLVIDAKAKQMLRDGIDVVGFGAGEPDFETPQHIKEAAVQAIAAGFTRYTPVAGALELREAICEKLHNDNQLQYQPQEIIVSNGAKHSLFNALAALLNPGDEVIIPAPYWVSYPELVKLNDGVPVIAPTTAAENFKLTAETLARLYTPRTKAVILNSPNNPTGQVYTRRELEALAEFILQHNLYVIADEIYEKLIYDRQEHFSIAALGPEIKARTIVVNGVSKAYAMTGWRIGYAAAAADIAALMNSVQSHATSNANAIAQKAATAALRGPQDCVAEMKAAFAQRRNYMVQAVKQLPALTCVEPQGAFYLFVDISPLFGRTYRGQVITGSVDFAAQLLEHAQVAVVPGTAFGAPDYLRFSYALHLTQIEKGMARLAQFVNNLE